MQSKVQQTLDDAFSLGLANRSENGYKISFNLAVRENPQFEANLKKLKRELQVAKATPVTRQQARTGDPVEGTSQAANPGDCGPGWRRRPVAQRQAIAIYRRMKAERQGSSDRKSRSRSRSRSTSRSRRRRSSARSRSPRTRSRSRSRSRGRNRSRSRSR